MYFAEVGNGVIVGLQALQQPLQFAVAAAFFFKFSAAAYFIKIAIQIEL